MSFITPPPSINSSTFNPIFFDETQDQQQSLFLTGITEGVASGSRALVVDSVRNINNIGQLSCSSLLVNGSPVSGAGASNGLFSPQTRTINGITVSGSVWHSTSDRFFGTRQQDSNNFSLLSYSAGGIYQDVLLMTHSATPTLTLTGLSLNQFANSTTTMQSYGRWLNSTASGPDIRLQLNSTQMQFGTFSNHALRLMANNNVAFWLQPSGNVSIGSDTNTHRLHVAGDINYTGSLRLNGTALTLDTIQGITNGQATANKALVLDASSNITGINQLSMTGDLIMNNVITTAMDIEKIDGITNGTATANKALILDGNGNIANINALSIQGTTNSLNGVRFSIITSPNTWSMYCYDTTNNIRTGITTSGWLGTLTNHPAILASNNIARAWFHPSGNCSIGANVDTHRLHVSGNLNFTGNLSQNGTTIAFDTIQGVVNGTASANKALIVNTNRDIGNINALSCASLTVNGVAITGSGGGTGDQTLITGITTIGVAQANKALTSDASLNTAGINQLTLSDRLNFNQNENRAIVRSVNGTSTFEIFHRNGIEALIGMTSNMGLILQTNAIGRLFIQNNGNITCGGRSSGAQAFNILSNNTNIALRIGGQESNNDCFTMQYTHVGPNSSFNRVSFDPFGSSNALCIRADRRICINGDDPSQALDVRGGCVLNTQGNILTLRASATAVINYTFNNASETNLILNGSNSDCIFSYSVANEVRACMNRDGICIGSVQSSNFGNVGLQITTQQLVSMFNNGNQFASQSTGQSFLSGASFMLSARFQGGVWTGSAGVIVSSDRRLKDDIKDYETHLDAYKRLRVCSYKWKQSGASDLGMIAQECGETIPHLVMTASDESMDDGVIHSISQSRLLYETVSALQQALKKIEILETQISHLTK